MQLFHRRVPASRKQNRFLEKCAFHFKLQSRAHNLVARSYIGIQTRTGFPSPSTKLTLNQRWISVLASPIKGKEFERIHGTRCRFFPVFTGDFLKVTDLPKAVFCGSGRTVDPFRAILPLYFPLGFFRPNSPSPVTCCHQLSIPSFSSLVRVTPLASTISTKEYAGSSTITWSPD